MMLRAFMGVVGSGKSYQADRLVAASWLRVDFKDALLDMASNLLGYNVRTDYEWFKSMPAGWQRPSGFYNQFYMKEDAWRAIGHGSLTGRLLLQRLGTEVMRRSYWIDLWATRVRGLLRSGLSVAVGDCRFRDEAEAVLSLEGKLVFCDYHSSSYKPDMAHESERMAQSLLAAGFRDLEPVMREHL